MQIQSLISSLCYLVGIFQVFKLINRKTLTILMLHGVMDQDAPSEWVPLRPQLPRRQLKMTLETLSKFGTFVSLEYAVNMLAGRSPFRRNALVLTFDDGYRNQLKYGLPILQELKIPAAFFLATGQIEKRQPYWFDRLDYALQHTCIAGREIRIGNDIIKFRSENRDHLRASYKWLRDSAKRANRPDHEMLTELQALAESLENESGHRLEDIFERDDWSALLTWQEIREAAAQKGVTFGSHTVDHTRLGLANEAEIRCQLLLSKESIERQTGKECRYFCFPSGSFSLHLLGLLEECGYEAAVTTQEGLNRRDQNRFALNRVNIPTIGGRADLLWQTLQVSRFKSTLRMGRKPALINECLTGD